ncbi:MAG: archaeal proteasome endopeptidase complex subunit alpha [Candidatus Nanoarchaeia archaeon]
MTNMQILPQQAMGYDRAITIWSPEGRLLQVEYAKRTVGHGALTLGIVYKDGVLLAADRRLTEKLIVADSVRKIFSIDEKIIATFSGFTSDARILIRKSRLFAQQHRLTYGEAPLVEEVVKHISDLEQAYTQYGGIRPFGVGFLFAGLDKKGLQLYETDPSGTYTQYLAHALGANSAEANKILEHKYKDNFKLEDAKKLAAEVFKEILGKEFNFERLEACIVTEKGVEKIELKE